MRSHIRLIFDRMAEQQAHLFTMQSIQLCGLQFATSVRAYFVRRVRKMTSGWEGLLFFLHFNKLPSVCNFEVEFHFYNNWSCSQCAQYSFHACLLLVDWVWLPKRSEYSIFFDCEFNRIFFPVNEWKKPTQATDGLIPGGITETNNGISEDCHLWHYGVVLIWIELVMWRVGWQCEEHFFFNHVLSQKFITFEWKTKKESFRNEHRETENNLLVVLGSKFTHPVFFSFVSCTKICSSTVGKYKVKT